MAGKGPVPAAEWTKHRQARVSANLHNRFVDTVANEPHLAHLGHQFYPDWNEDASYIGEKAGTSTEHGAAAAARLSPKTDANANRMMTYQALHMPERALRHIDSAADFAGARADTHNPKEARKLAVAESDSRLRAGLRGTPLNLQTSTSIRLSLQSLHGDTATPLKDLGKVKIRDFGGLINNPYAEHHWPFDRHLAAAGYGVEHLLDEQMKVFASPPAYEQHRNAADRAYRAGVKSGNVDPSVTPPGAHMGTVWMGHIQAKLEAPGGFAARRAMKARDSMIGNFLNHENAHLWDPAKHGQAPIRPYSADFRF